MVLLLKEFNHQIKSFQNTIKLQFIKQTGTGLLPKNTRILVTGPKESAIEHLVFAASPLWPAPLFKKITDQKIENVFRNHKINLILN